MWHKCCPCSSRWPLLRPVPRILLPTPPHPENIFFCSVMPRPEAKKCCPVHPWREWWIWAKPNRTWICPTIPNHLCWSDKQGGWTGLSSTWTFRGFSALRQVRCATSSVWDSHLQFINHRNRHCLRLGLYVKFIAPQGSQWWRGQ